MIRLACFPARAALFCFGFGLAAVEDAAAAGVHTAFNLERAASHQL